MSYRPLGNPFVLPPGSGGLPSPGLVLPTITEANLAPEARANTGAGQVLTRYFVPTPTTDAAAGPGVPWMHYALYGAIALGGYLILRRLF